MQFHGLMLLRDEGDIVAESLAHLLTWLDALHIYDLGSTDGTWDIVQDFAARDTRVIPYKREPTVYSDSLRCVLFEHCRRHFAAGDWVLKIDGDEFYHVAPPAFVRERLRPSESMVYLQWYFFRLTTTEAAAYDTGAVSIAADRARSIRDRRRFYKVSRYAEPRMFRYRETMRWPSTVHWPYNTGLVARERIPILHYPHRDPAQMRARFALRAAMMERSAKAGDHWRTDDWQSELVDPATGVTVGVARGARRGLAGENGIDTGPLLHWEPGTPLPEVHLHDQVAPLPRRLAQRFVHATLLPWLDRRRPGFDAAYRPQIIPNAENARIGAQCSPATADRWNPPDAA